MLVLPIFTNRLELRRFSHNDLQTFQEYRRDPELSKLQGWEPTSDDDALAFLNEQSVLSLGPEGRWLQIAVTCIHTKRLMGDFGVCVHDSKRGMATMGFTISRPFQRHGYATEAANGILSELFKSDLIHEVVSETDARNEAAILLLQRLGFVLTNTFPTMFRGEPCTEHAFSMPAIRWRALNA